MSRISDFWSGLVPQRGSPPRKPARNPLAQQSPGDGRPVVLTTLLMAEEAARSRVLTLARRHRRLRMVVVTDDDRVSAFLSEGCVVEHMPGAVQMARHAVPGDPDVYLRRRWQIILTKWEPALVREEGAALNDFLRACRLPGTATVERSDGSSLSAP